MFCILDTGVAAVSVSCIDVTDEASKGGGSAHYLHYMYNTLCVTTYMFMQQRRKFCNEIDRYSTFTFSRIAVKVQEKHIVHSAQTQANVYVQ